MNSIWGKSFNYKRYSQKAFDLALSKIDENRKIVKREFLKDEVLNHDRSLFVGRRFNNDEDILWVLQSNVNEKEFLSDSDFHLRRILAGALSADYYYTYEKEW